MLASSAALSCWPPWSGAGWSTRGLPMEPAWGSRSCSRCRSATSTTTAFWASTAAIATRRWRHSAFAGIPPTKTCMNCHTQIWVGSPMLEPVRESYRTEQVAPLASRLQFARLRLLRPQHPRAEGGRLLDVSRPDRRDALHLPGADAADGVVPRLPSQSGRERPPARRGVQHEVPAARQSAAVGAEAG